MSTGRGRLARQGHFARDALVTAIRSLWSRRVRAALTLCGIGAACATLTTAYALLATKQQEAIEDLRRNGETRFIGVSSTTGLSPELGEQLAGLVPGIAAHSPYYSTRSPMSARYASADARVVGVSAAAQPMSLIALKSGRLFTEADVEHASLVCVIGAGLAANLRLRIEPGDAHGPTVELLGQPVEVIGVMVPRKGTMPGCGEYDRCAIVPETTLRQLEPSAPMSALGFLARSEDDVDEAVAALRYRLRHLLGQSRFQADRFEIVHTKHYIDQLHQEMRLGWAVIYVVVSLTLFLGGIGVMNIMLVTVNERTSEIGLRKALGARPAQILWQFLLECVVLCATGGCVGTVAGAGIAVVVASHFARAETELVLPAGLVLASAGFALLSGIVFGLLPAIKASRLDPLVALRRI